jgi:RHS repeat-associated protein
VTTFDYYPYGEEKPSATANERDKFATYMRDATGLDYADQRYFNSTWGRFTTPDPHVGSMTSRDPVSFNRFVYAHSDPITFNDPTGLIISIKDKPIPIIVIHCPSFYLFGSLGGCPGINPTPFQRGDRAPHQGLPGALDEILDETVKEVKELLKDGECADSIGAGSSEDAAKRLDSTNVQFKDLGDLTFTTGDNGELKSGGAVGNYVPGIPLIRPRAINLNTRVNWLNPSNSSAVFDGELRPYDLLEATAVQLGVQSVSRGSLMQLTILHELRHSFGEDHGNAASSVGEFNREIYDKCIK